MSRPGAARRFHPFAVFATGLLCLAVPAARADIMYVSNISNTIEKFTSGGVGSVFASAALNHPMGLAFDSTGNLNVSTTGNNTIVKFTSDGVASLFASTGLNDPYDLAFDSAGNLYAANARNST